MCVERIPHTLESKEIQPTVSEEGRRDQKRGAVEFTLSTSRSVRQTFFARSPTVKKVQENGPGGADRMVQ